MNNTINFSTTTLNSVSRLASKVSSTCDQLIVVLEISVDSVSSYGVRISSKAMSTDFVDRVVSNLLLVKKHMFDLRKNIRHHENFQSSESISSTIEHLLVTRDKLTIARQENNYFHNTYWYLLDEINEMIDAVVLKLPVQ